MFPVTIAQLRLDFPEFASTAVYTDAVVQFWITVTTSLINQERWGVLSQQGQELAVAHYLVLAAKDEAAAAAGIPPGSVGLVASKTVGPVSLGYDNGVATEEDGGFWNLTTYGLRYLRLARMMGAGGIQLNPPCWGFEGFPGPIIF